ncbi:MAG: ABC transporter ATP-binding protein [Alphaproteobacteria bacterium]|nr:MAG: ABC transporter ATP-binding protein [Alphaproteobacteria bacterium]
MNKPLSSADILRIENLTISFRQPDGSVRRIIDDVSFTIKSGEITGLVGESGSGKSVCGYSILRLLPYPTAFHNSGTIYVGGMKVLDATINALDGQKILNPEHILSIRKHTARIIFQEPLSALNPLYTAGDQLMECITTIDPHCTATDKLQRAYSLLAQVELQNPCEIMGRYPHQLSGGQRQRLMIAMALSSDPQLLIADEPTTALDVTTQYHILNLLKNIQKRTGMAILFISHDLGVVKNFADHIVVMEAGHVVETGKTRIILTNPTHSYTQRLLDAHITGTRGTTNPLKPLLLDAKNLHLTYTKQGFFRKQAGHQALRNVSFSLRKGETLGVVGESGSGKTTLAFAIVRLVTATGVINLYKDGQKTDVLRLSSHELQHMRRTVQIVFQDPFTSLNPRMTVGDIICEGATLHTLFTDKNHRLERLSRILNDVGLDDSYEHRYPHELSGGQRQRVSIARSLILSPEIIILDEPTSALDRQVQKSILSLLRTLQDEKELSYIFISHDLNVVRYMAHELMIMKDGSVCEYGNAETIFTTPHHPYTQELLAASQAMTLI